MKRSTIGLTILLFVLIMVPAVWAQGGQSVFDMAAADYRLTTFEAAVEAAGLRDSFSSGTWTVFAPTDEAFAALRLNPDNISDLSEGDLQAIVLYHAVPKFVSLADAKAMTGDQVMANGQIAGWKWYDDTLYLNDFSRVIDGNHLASNGYLHVVDKVVQGPWPRPLDEVEEPGLTLADIRSEDLTMADYLALDGRFSTTAQAIEYAGLTEMLSGGIYTFFAPANQAYRRYNEQFPDHPTTQFSPEEMRDFLLYHIYPGHMSIAKSRTMLGDITMANGEPAGLKWWRRNLWVNDFTRVAIRDIHVANGVIQGVRDPVLGPWPRVEAPQSAQDSGLIE